MVLELMTSNAWAPLMTVGVRTVFLCGDCDPKRLAAEARAAGYQVGGNTLADRWSLRLKREGEKGALTVLPISRWVDTQDVSHHRARRVMLEIGSRLVRRFGQRLCPTPSETGFWAWKTTGGYYDRLPEGIRRAFAGTQGRFEVCPVVETIPALYCLDMRLAYSAAALQIQSASEWKHEVRPQGGWND
jgi:hypothetical protein